jgi:hypothetical protein
MGSVFCVLRMCLLKNAVRLITVVTQLKRQLSSCTTQLSFRDEWTCRKRGLTKAVKTSEKPLFSHVLKSAEQFASQIRRLFRVLLHCYHAHRDVFKQFESEFFLAKRVVVFARRYQFLDDDTLAQIPIVETVSEKTEDDEHEEEEQEEEEEEEGIYLMLLVSSFDRYICCKERKKLRLRHRNRKNDF